MQNVSHREPEGPSISKTQKPPQATGFAYANLSEIQSTQKAKMGLGKTALTPSLPTGQMSNPPSSLAKANIKPANQMQPTSLPLPTQTRKGPPPLPTQTKKGPPPLPTQTKKGSPQPQMLTQEQIHDKSSQLKQEENLLYNYPFSRTPSQNEVELANSRQKRIEEIKIQLSELELQKKLIESRNELQSFQTTISTIIIPKAQEEGTEDRTRKDIKEQVDAMNKEIQIFETQIQDLHKTYQHLFPIKKI